MYWTPPAQVIFNPHATPTASSSTDSLLAAADVAESAADVAAAAGADVAAAVGAKVAAAGPPLPKPLLPEVAAPLVAPGGQQIRRVRLLVKTPAHTVVESVADAAGLAATLAADVVGRRHGRPLPETAAVSLVFARQLDAQLSS